MTPPIDPADLALLLKTLPKERPDPFPHLADLNATQLLTRRIWITSQLKALDEERQVIDSEIQALFGDAELRFGVVAPNCMYSRLLYTEDTLVEATIHLPPANCKVTSADND